MLNINQGCRRSLTRITSFANQRYRHDVRKPTRKPWEKTRPPNSAGTYKERSSEPFSNRQNVPYPKSRQHGQSSRTGAHQIFQDSHFRHPASRHPGPFQNPVHPPHVHQPPVIAEGQVVQFFMDKVDEWAARPHTVARMVSYGLEKGSTLKLLKIFVEDVKSGALSDDESKKFYQLDRFAQPHDETSIDVIFNTTLFWWAAKMDNAERFETEFGINQGTLRTIRQLVEVTAREFPADEFQNARSLHRKIIMHVGPTNSGKTHHALRSLAAARTGMYAGPLRLLAHEIYQRLNAGQIAPLTVEEQAPKNPKGNPAYVRPCNLITGEERRIVDENASHASCTIEMVAYTKRFDVAVIDEIQMIGNPDRGPSWLSAVVGLWSPEVHLCGEETAVPLVKALLEHTGDEIEVRHYGRLTPLVVEDESLNGDFTKVRKGDCIVAFNRSSIFAIKKTVEEVTGMRCAVVYGRLPPEVRSEQAALFNDPDSGYDVIIGSDAIGMGLNLKIKRVIFSATTKYNGQTVVPLDVTAVKQIAGRAGRYGLHKEQADLGGTTTTLYDEDLPHLHHCVAVAYKPLPYVHIGIHINLLGELLSVLPTNTPMHTVISAAKYIARLPPYIRYANDLKLVAACEFIDAEWRFMTNEDKVALLNAPIPWRDLRTMEVLRKIMQVHARGECIEFAPVMQGTGLLEMMEDLDRRMQMEKAGIPIRSVQIANALMQMETLHKILVFYMWMSFRCRLLYSDSEMVHHLKEKLEGILNWTLDNLSKKLVKEQGLKGLSPLINKRVLENRPNAEPLLVAALNSAS